jgi:glyoxylase-like metal-dependent hydrolase (beta-lactamase superfamily II)
MRELAEGVWQLDGFPKNNVNVYVIGDVLIDAGMPFDKGRIAKQIMGREISAHALTHSHPDHVGASHAICSDLGLPLWCGADDVESVERGQTATRFFGGWVPGPAAHPVDKALHEGDEVGGFKVLDTPGHSPGHISYWRESDKTLLCGDVFFGYNPFLLIGGLREPPRLFSFDPAQNRDSARRLARLEPELVCFGHGPPLRDPRKLARFADSLPT